jgi:hypothetical protein
MRRAGSGAGLLRAAGGRGGPRALGSEAVGHVALHACGVWLWAEVAARVVMGCSCMPYDKRHHHHYLDMHIKDAHFQHCRTPLPSLRFFSHFSAPPSPQTQTHTMTTIRPPDPMPRTTPPHPTRFSYPQDAAAQRALGVFPSRADGTTGGSTFSLYGLLNRCRTPGGKRTLRTWLKQPLVDVRRQACSGCVWCLRMPCVRVASFSWP